MTLNLPKAPGFNGTYHLIQFANGPATASGFTLGTVPTLAWNQTGTLQVNGNYLDYVITAAGDTTPPTLANILPANNAANILADTDLVATFDETVVAGSGSIELRRSSDAGLVESFNVTSSPRLAISTAQLIINPTANLPTGQSYQVRAQGLQMTGGYYGGDSSIHETVALMPASAAPEIVVEQPVNNELTDGEDTIAFDTLGETRISVLVAWPHLRRDAPTLLRHWPMMLLLSATGIALAVAGRPDVLVTGALGPDDRLVDVLVDAVRALRRGGTSRSDR